MNEVKFEYKPKAWLFLLVIALFSGMTWFFTNEASTNDRGLTINHLIALSTFSATVLFWFFAGFMAVLTILSAFVLIAGLRSTNEIVITDTHITAPKRGITDKSVSVGFDEISDVQVQVMQKQKFLNIFHSGGKLTIVRSMLPTKEDFDALTNLVVERAGIIYNR